MTIPAKVRVISENNDMEYAEDENSDEESIKSEQDSVKSEPEYEDSDSQEQMDESENENGLMNAAWADSVSKILKAKKPKKKKTLVLSKAKKLTDLKKESPQPAGFEIETPDGDVKEEKIDIKTIDTATLIGQPPHKKKRELPNLRVKPNILEKDRERTLQKIATKGVVQLFNAVKVQQKEISDKLKEAGPLEAKKEKVLKNLDKRDFLDMVMGGKTQRTENNVQPVNSKQTENRDATWSVLKDDFMMSAKMKDWDKELEQDSDSD